VPARTRARKRALDILYAAELRGENALDALARAVDAGEGPSNPYTGFLVGGVVDHQARIDELLTEYSQGWALNRMPAVDRTALRIGVFELMWADDVPDAVAVDEAVSLVRELSTDDSPGFVNGVLGTMLRDKDRIGGSAP
jgi:N utilization substance protein B